MIRQSSLVACTFAACLVGACASDPYNGASVGSACASVGAQSSCDETEICSAISTNNMCSLSCTSDTDCGENTVPASTDGESDADGGTITNHCVNYQASAICMRGCSPTLPGACQRSDFVCITQDQGGEYYCVPDCRLQPTGFCSYPQQCNKADGQCEGQICTVGTNSTCPSGQICGTVNGQALCVVSCQMDGCPEGSTCNTTGGCDTVELGPYALCGTGIIGACPTGYACASGSNTSVCMPTCTGSSGSSCNTESTAATAGVCASGVCVATCGFTTGCPTNTACVATDGGAEFCVPQ